MEHNDHMKDIEHLKEMWNEMNTRLEKLEKQTRQETYRLPSTKVHTAKDDLAQRYLRFMVIGTLMAGCFPLFIMTDHSEMFPDTSWKCISAILFCIYFLTAALMDLYLYRKVKRIDLSAMSVEKVISEVRTLKHRHHIFMAILIPLAIATIGIFILSIMRDKYIIYGIAAGAVIGLAIGTIQYKKMMKDYRQIMQEYA